MKIIAYNGTSLCKYHWNDGYRPTNTRQPMGIHGGFTWKWWMCMTFLHVNDFAGRYDRHAGRLRNQVHME